MPILFYLTKRALQTLLVMFAVTLFARFAIRLTGDLAVMKLSQAANATAEDLARIREAMGLNRPFHVQYLDFIGGLLAGGLGTSFVRGPVAPFIATGLPAALLLAVTSLALSIPLGVYAATHRGSLADQAIRIVSLVRLSFPNFWLGIMMVLLFTIKLRWLTPSGFIGPASLIIMPTATIGIILTATNLRIVRTTMLDVLWTQYIVVARAKGLPERKVVYKHAVRNSSIAIVTYLGLQFGGLMGGIVVVEQVFGRRPGMGTLATDAISQRNYPILQAAISIIAITILGVSLMVDLTYVVLDPRIRLE